MRVLGAVLALALIVAVILGLLLGTRSLIELLAPSLGTEIALGYVTISSTALLAVWQFSRSRKREAEARIFSQRAIIYDELIMLLRDVFWAEKGWSDDSEGDRARKLSTITYKLIVWGGKDTIKAVNQIRGNVKWHPGAPFLLMSEIFGAMRSDLGHGTDVPLADELALQMLRIEDHAYAREQIAAARAQRLESRNVSG